MKLTLPQSFTTVHFPTISEIKDNNIISLRNTLSRIQHERTSFPSQSALGHFTGSLSVEETWRLPGQQAIGTDGYGGVFVSVLETSVLPRHFRFAAAKGNCQARADISGTFAAAKIAAGPRSIVSLFL